MRLDNRVLNLFRYVGLRSQSLADPTLNYNALSGRRAVSLAWTWLRKVAAPRSKSSCHQLLRSENNRRAQDTASQPHYDWGQSCHDRSPNVGPRSQSLADPTLSYCALSGREPHCERNLGCDCELPSVCPWVSAPGMRECRGQRRRRCGA